jgi:hypothetical protein
LLNCHLHKSRKLVLVLSTLQVPTAVLVTEQVLIKYFLIKELNDQLAG